MKKFFKFNSGDEEITALVVGSKIATAKRKERKLLDKQATIRNLRAQAEEYFSLLLMLRRREDYRDELAAELRRIDDEIADLDAQLITSTKKVAKAILTL